MFRMNPLRGYPPVFQDATSCTVARNFLLLAADASGTAWQLDTPRTELVQRAFLGPGLLGVAAEILYFKDANHTIFSTSMNRLI